MSGWYGVDLDGTLAYHDEHTNGIGRPIVPMVERVKRWLAKGREVRIVTARAAHKNPAEEKEIKAWCKQHLGQELEVTASKDFEMIELWDDRAIQVVTNRGIPATVDRRRFE